MGVQEDHRRRLLVLQNAIDRARARIEACQVRRIRGTKAREKALAAEDWASAHKHIEKLKPLFAEERAANQAYSNALDALSEALEEIEHGVRARRRPARK